MAKSHGIRYDNCKDCKSRCAHAGKNRIFVCPKGVSCKVKKETFKTNADRIRAMSDEELAKHLWAFADLDAQIQFCKNLPECEKIFDTGDEIPDEKCFACLLEWLRQPAEMKENEHG